MTRWKFLAILLLIACMCLACLWGVTAYRLAQTEETVNEYIKKELKDKGFQEGTYKSPDISDAPEGSKPLIHATGTVHYPPKKLVSPLGADVHTSTGFVAVAPVAGSPTLDIPRGNPCNLDELDVTIGCTLDAMAEPGKPWARMLAFGKIEGWGQIRELEPLPAGKVDFQVVPSAKPKTWGMNFLAGAAIGQRNGIEAGLQWTGKKRLGGYALVEYQYATSSTSYDSYSESFYSSGDTSTVRFHGGISIRLK